MEIIFQVNGCLSFSEKITDGFYNILGMDPYLWAMCNNSEEGKMLPRLAALNEVEPCESSMEVVLIDRKEDSHLKYLEKKALKYYSASGFSLATVKQLAGLVSKHMGYIFPFNLNFLFLRSFYFFNLLHFLSGSGAFKTEQEELHQRWKICSEELKNNRQHIVILIGSLSFGLCRHRAILFKVRNHYWAAHLLLVVQHTVL